MEVFGKLWEEIQQGLSNLKYCVLGHRVLVGTRTKTDGELSDSRTKRKMPLKFSKPYRALEF